MAGPPGAGKKMEGVDNLELGEKQKEEMLRHLTSIANDTQDMMMKGGLAREVSHRPTTGAAGWRFIEGYKYQLHFSVNHFLFGKNCL